MTMLKVCVMSASRPGNVLAVQTNFPSCVWYVPSDQVDTYRAGGAKDVVGVDGTMPMKTVQLNVALDYWFDRMGRNDTIATVDDDLIGFRDINNKTVIRAMDLVKHVGQELARSLFYLGGPYSGSNEMWAGGIVKHSGPMCGAMLLHKKNKLRFDSNCESLDDYDYCLQHHCEFGGVLYHCGYRVSNLWRGNSGGYQDTRSSESEAKLAEHLAAKWGHLGVKVELDPSHKRGIKLRTPWIKLARMKK